MRFDRRFVFGIALALFAGCSLPDNLRDAHVPSDDVGDQDVDQDAIASMDAGPGEDVPTLIDALIPDQLTPTGDVNMPDARLCSTNVRPSVLTPLAGAAYATRSVEFAARAPGALRIEFEIAMSSNFAGAMRQVVPIGTDGVARFRHTFTADEINRMRVVRAWALCATDERGPNASAPRWFRVGTRVDAIWSRPAVERIELDTDGDGRTDLAVRTGAGVIPDSTVQVYRRGGAASSSLTRVNRTFGASITAVGDVDDDGFGDLLIGTSSHLIMSINAGLVQVFSGTGDEVRTTPSIEVTSSGRGGTASEFGLVTAALGDVNEDGIADFAVGERGMTGAVYIYRSPHVRSGASPAQSLQTTGFTEMTAMIAADFDGDGDNDLAVGYGDSASGTGTVLLYRFEAGGFNAVSVPLTPPAGVQGFGKALAAGALLNDGRINLVVAAPGTATTAGEVLVYEDPFNSTRPPHEFRRSAGSTAGALFGQALAVLGDRDGDGRSELAVLHPGAIDAMTSRRSAVRIADIVTGGVRVGTLSWGTSNTSPTLTRGFCAAGGFVDSTNAGRLSVAFTRDGVMGAMPVVEVLPYTMTSGSWTTSSPISLMSTSSGFGDRLTALRASPRWRGVPSPFVGFDVTTIVCESGEC